MMHHSFRVKPTHKWFATCLAFVVVFVGSVNFLIMDELRSVRAHNELKFLRSRYIPISCQSDPKFEGLVVHIDCPITKFYKFHPPSEFSQNVSPFKGVFFELKAEMYRWDVQPFLFFFAQFRRIWSTTLQTPTGWFSPVQNPAFQPSIHGVGRKFAPELLVGSYRLHRKHLATFQQKTQLPLVDDNVFEPSLERPPTSVDSRNTLVYNNALYTGDPHNPKIGDLRITFWGSTATHVSAIGQQRNRLFATEITGYKPYSPLSSSLPIFANASSLPIFANASSSSSQSDPKPSEPGSVTQLVFEGDHSPEAMFKLYKTTVHGSDTTFLVWRFISISCLAVIAANVCSLYWSIPLSKQLSLDHVACFLIAYGFASVLGGLVWLTSLAWYCLLQVSIGTLCIAGGCSCLFKEARAFRRRDMRGDVPCMNFMELAPLQTNNEDVNDRLLSDSNSEAAQSMHYYQPV